MTCQLDVCNSFERIGVCDTFTFNGVLRQNTVGEWSAEIPEGGIDFDGDATIDDVDSVMLWDTNPTRIVYAGTMRAGSGASAGLTTSVGPEGTRWSLSGVDLFGVLATRVAYPNPETESPWTLAYDERDGAASTVAAQYITANLGSLALTDRQVGTVETIDPGVGNETVWTARLQPLSQLVAEICNGGEIVCRPSMPTAGTIRYTFTTGADLSSQTVISDRDLSAGLRLTTANATATHVIAGGSGELTDRTFVRASDHESTGLDRIELFYEVGNLTQVSAITMAAKGALRRSKAETAVEFDRILPTHPWSYPDDFDLGDLISVEVDGVRYPVIVEGVSFNVTPVESSIMPVIGRTTTNEALRIIRGLRGQSERLNTNIA